MCLGLTVPAMAAGYTEVVPCKYERVGNFSDGLAAVAVRVGTDKYDNGIYRWGFIDKAGNEVVPCQYVYPDGYYPNQNPRFSEDLAAMVVDDGTEYKIMNYIGKYCFINRTGKEIVPGKYDTASNFSEGLAMVGVWDGTIERVRGLGTFYNYDCGFIDKTGKVVIPIQYDHAADFSEGLAAVQDENGKWGFIDQTGKMIIPFQYNAVQGFSEGLAVVNRGGKYGYIDKAGKEVVPCQYAWACPVSEGMAAVAVKGKNSEARNFKWGFVCLGGTQPTVPTVGNFTDVKTSDYFAEPVAWAVEKGITSGTSATTFSPNQNCSVSQILTFLWRANGSPKPTTANPFTDVKSGDYYAEAAVWAYEKGMVSGSTFGGNTPCTRSMAVTYMWKAAGSPSAKSVSFTDVPAGAEYASAVAWAVEQGITSGTGNGQFGPNGICNRGQIVTFLYRAFAK